MAKEVFKTFTGKTFRFACHPEVPCFTECCAKLRLVLTPYDIVRIKNRLGLSSDAFLDAYTDMIVEDSCRFPLVKLKMREDDGQACPFLEKKGCAIYEDRPGACRLYPLGRAATAAGGSKRAAEQFFLVEEAHCRGFEENREWTVADWAAHEGLDQYNQMNDKWLEILTSRKGLGPKEIAAKKVQMFFMASYNLDRFREFVFHSRFFQLFEVDPAVKGKIAENDVDLMLFAFEWLKHALFGETAATFERQTPPASEKTQ